MKSVWMFGVVLLISFAVPRDVRAQKDKSVSYKKFYDNLSQYGQWINDDQYGYVWIPRVNDEFRPYFTDGHWVMTENGNTWVSNYAWGWACFHYGRWTYNDYYGWIWVPGSEWSPGWVVWRWGGGFCGWAPLYPGTKQEGGDCTIPNDWWVFLQVHHLYMPRYLNIWRGDFWNGPLHTQKLLRETEIVANTPSNDDPKFYSGPHASDVEQATHKAITVYKLNVASGPGADNIINNIVYMYHPAPMAQIPIEEYVNLSPPQVLQAPQPVADPEEIHITWNQQRPYKLYLQKVIPAWKLEFSRDSPPYYYNYPSGQSEISY